MQALNLGIINIYLYSSYLPLSQTYLNETDLQM